MRTVQVRYFAALRESAGLGRESVVTEARSLADLYREISAKRGFVLTLDQIKASKNGDWVDLSANIADGDEIVFIPPVAGG